MLISFTSAAVIFLISERAWKVLEESYQGRSSLAQTSFEELAASSHTQLCPLKGELLDLIAKFKSKFSSSLAIIEGCQEKSCNQ